jgi:hypothetical protein
MSIPLDRLEQFNVIIYRFWPHGSKKLEDLQELSGPTTWQEKIPNFSIYCHDQEPLNYDLYRYGKIQKSEFTKILQSISCALDVNLMYHPTIYDQICLIHSEKRSLNLTLYQNHPNRQCIDVYYWCHALISIDWFRYARHVRQQKQVKKTFLIYNRAWSGTREYRLKFVEMLINFNLQDHCRTTVNPVEPELRIHYNQHQFDNPAWRPQIVLENYFSTNNTPSHYSADFHIEDYEATDIEVVLETLFDDSRLHLTEKSLRPIACGQPFILAGTHGSLEYLHSYGFKTFDTLWNESYDSIEDPQERMYAITDLMKTISNWTHEEKIDKLARARIITDYNKKHFFSTEFFNQVVTELEFNLTTALTQLKSKSSVLPFLDRWKKLLTYDEVLNYLSSTQDAVWPTLNQVKNVLNIASQKLKP